jgi:hypothetical protein
MPNYRTTLTYDAVSELLDYNPETGVFRWRHRAEGPKKWNSRYAGTEAGYISLGYRVIQIGGRVGYSAARLAWLLYYKEWPPAQVDHINGNQSDNRICNLRAATNAENNQNRIAQRNSTTGVKGVTVHTDGRFRARIFVNKKPIEGGCYHTLEEATKARRQLELRYHGEFAPSGNTKHGTYDKWKPTARKPSES